MQAPPASEAAVYQDKATCFDADFLDFPFSSRVCLSVAICRRADIPAGISVNSSYRMSATLADEKPLRSPVKNPFF
jgi:hypothetical protein